VVAKILDPLHTTRRPALSMESVITKSVTLKFSHHLGNEYECGCSQRDFNLTVEKEG
jgi:hypothetical protein